MRFFKNYDEDIERLNSQITALNKVNNKHYTYLGEIQNEVRRLFNKCLVLEADVKLLIERNRKLREALDETD